LIVLVTQTVVTAFVTGTLVGSLRVFATGQPLEFFVAVVIVAIVGTPRSTGRRCCRAAREGQAAVESRCLSAQIVPC